MNAILHSRPLPAPPSCAANLGLRPQSGLTPHSAWLALGATPADRANAYRHPLEGALPEDALADIRPYLQQQRAWGRNDFRTMVEAKIRRFAGTRPAHRPPKASSTDSEPDPVLVEAKTRRFAGTRPAHRLRGATTADK